MVEARATGGLHSLFEQQSARTPDAVAVTADSCALTYRELNRSANRLARALRAQGVAPQRLVGIALGPSPECVIAMLAVLKAGAAYVGLDPAAPQARLRFAMEDLDVSLTVSLEPASTRLRTAGAMVLDLRGDRDAFAFQPATNLGVPIEPRQLAYAIYTSGSTGRPKAVGIEHGAALSFLHWARTVFDADALAGSVATAPLTVDCTLFEICAPLSWGGRVVLVPTLLDLPTAAHAGAATLVSTVPRVMTELIRARALPRSVATVNLAGDSVPIQLVADLRRLKHVRKVFNHYGPSETTTYSTSALLVDRTNGHPTGAVHRPTIGRPIANTRIHVLDRRGLPVPIGVSGELCIAGAGLARGYLGRPALTAERFVPDHEPDDPGARLYRTGDLTRLGATGELEFLGRLDRQLKVRGFRVEPGEIEAVLARHSAVREAAVGVRESRGRGARLVAWVVLVGARRPNSDELTRHLAGQVPSYMVPTTFVPVDALPRTHSGKVDHAALASVPLPGDVEPPRLEELLVPPGGPPRAR